MTTSVHVGAHPIDESHPYLIGTELAQTRTGRRCSNLSAEMSHPDSMNIDEALDLRPADLVPTELTVGDGERMCMWPAS